MPAATLRNDAPTPDTLALYLREVGSFSLISPAEEVRLAQCIRDGDQDAVDTLVRANLRFVVSVAKHYQHQGVPLVDLISDGNLGLIRAAHRFDETKGVRFISYAVWWIRQAILQGIAEQSRVVRVPLNRAGALAKLGRRSRRLEQELGREPTHEELATGVDLSEREVANTMAIAQPHLSLDAPFRGAEDGHLLDVMADGRAPSADDESIQRALTETVENALSVLKPREAKILRLYFGFEGDEPMTLEQIGALLGITRERVRQIKEKALHTIRRSRHGRALATFND